MSRKAGVLLPIELSILEAAMELHRRGMNEFHGFMIAAEISEAEGSRLLTAYGTLYKALSRMEKVGLLESHWEDPLIAAAAERPRRRLYRLTAVGEKALVEGVSNKPDAQHPLQKGLAPL